MQDGRSIVGIYDANQVTVHLILHFLLVFVDTLVVNMNIITIVDFVQQRCIGVLIETVLMAIVVSCIEHRLDGVAQLGRLCQLRCHVDVANGCLLRCFGKAVRVLTAAELGEKAVLGVKLGVDFLRLRACKCLHERLLEVVAKECVENRL